MMRESILVPMEGNKTMKTFLVCAAGCLIFLSGCAAPGRLHDGHQAWHVCLPHLILFKEKMRSPKKGGASPTGSERELIHSPIAQR